uniref:Uncharacterized protein n=1 Tax=Brassica campestris TaxID=3711 RepID=M4DVT6_BRACM
MGKTRGMGPGRSSRKRRPPYRSLFRPLSVGERGLQRKRLAALSRMKNTLGSKVSLPNQSDKSLKRTDQTTLVSGTDIQFGRDEENTRFSSLVATLFYLYANNPVR